jgi:hypothetical protein
LNFNPLNKQEFTYLLSNPAKITAYQTNMINSVIEEFPYFQSARALYLKGLKNQESFKYNQELKTTAAYTTDRSILFDFITSEAFIQNEISQFIKQNDEHLKEIDVSMEDISVNKSVTIDDRLKQQIIDTIGVLDPTLFEPKEERVKKTVPFTLDTTEAIEKVTEETKTQEASASDILKLGKPLEFDKRESHSFSEWLKLTRFKPIKRENEPVAEDKPEIENNEPTLPQETIQDDIERAKKFEMIDKFISQNPKIDPKTPTNPKLNLAKLQNIQPEELMTETLARIYVEQKNYSKAIQSYKILSLKYPEKSSFFANQIKAVEELQEHNNKE